MSEQRIVKKVLYEGEGARRKKSKIKEEAI